MLRPFLLCAQVFLWDVASGRTIRKFHGHNRRERNCVAQFIRLLRAARLMWLERIVTTPTSDASTNPQRGQRRPVRGVRNRRAHSGV